MEQPTSGGTDFRSDGVRHGRLPWFEPDELDEEQLRMYHAIVDGPRSKGPRASNLTDDMGRLQGPFNSRLLSPRIGEAIQAVGAELRFNSHLSEREQEIVILEVAAAEGAEYVWDGHSRRALRAGLSDAAVDAIRSGADAPEFTDRERISRRVAQALITTRDLDDALFEEAREQLGLASLFDLVSTVGHYQNTAMSVRVWRVPRRKRS